MTIDDFQTCLGQKFIVTPENEDGLELELIQVEPLGVLKPEADTRQSFSALFRGPLEPILQQHSYPIDNAVLGEQILFLVPVGPDEYGMLYDATFN